MKKQNRKKKEGVDWNISVTGLLDATDLEFLESLSFELLLVLLKYSSFHYVVVFLYELYKHGRVSATILALKHPYISEVLTSAPIDARKYKNWRDFLLKKLINHYE